MRRWRHRAAIMRALPAIALVIAIGTGMTGCASGERAEQQREIAALRSQVEEMRKSEETQARELARLAGQMKALDAQSTFVISEVKASSEERARVTAALAESGAALKTLETTVNGLSKAMAAVQAAPSAAAPTPSPAASPAELYEAAMASLRAEAHLRAVSEFRELTTRFPDDPLASNAQYWIGEAYYRQRDFSEAVLEFRKVIDRYAGSAQVPEALLKIGLCHRELKDQARARVAWEQLAKEFPTSNAAGQARSLLSTLGGPGAAAQ